VRLALAGEPIPVYGDGTQRRSFTWVGDVVGAMLALIAHPKAYGEVFNIGHTEEISIYDLAVLVKKMTGSASEIVLVPYEQAYEAGFEDVARAGPGYCEDPAAYRVLAGAGSAGDAGEGDGV
jgi:UDP-glucose 4-epimerase